MDDYVVPADLTEMLENLFDSNISSNNKDSNSNEDLEEKNLKISRLAASLIFGL